LRHHCTSRCDQQQQQQQQQQCESWLPAAEGTCGISLVPNAVWTWLHAL
jgi:hypothetical protein